ncbi:MAG TPA: cupredoxin family protein [Usitatibacter sp.]|jgi:uncharacterized cupredoxin-like copper-binding protein|nr:cupredoxin family protein [Usitatibacter sp.]
MRYRIAASLAPLGLAATLALAHGDGDGDLPFGRPGKASEATRTIAVSMTDAMRFEPAEIRARAGETVRIVVANTGKLRHEFVLGTMEELREHAEMMRKSPGMQHHEPKMASVAPGGKATIVWRFTKAGTFHYACLEPGHLEAGMVGTVVVR